MRVIGESKYEDIRRREAACFATGAVNVACISYANERGIEVAVDAALDSFYKAKRDAELSFDEDNGGES